jgi:Polysaccharide pyruvyl transferase
MVSVTFGLLTYESLDDQYNEGDYIQSIAAAQFLPEIEAMASRERLDTYSGDLLSIILNGWFMHEPQHWPPSEKIDPLFVSFHINKPYARQMLSAQGVAYLKEMEPIGCRDYYTMKILQEQGIEAYYTGCLTLTLDDTFKREASSIGNDILMVDVAHAVPTLELFMRTSWRNQISHIIRGNILRMRTRQLIRDHMVEKCRVSAIPTNAIELQNSKSGNFIDHVKRFATARERLELYRTAKLVITSRIHCALPCLAMGTPVIFVKSGQTSPSNLLRFHGILDFMNVVDLDGDMRKFGFKSDFLSIGDINVENPLANPTRHIPYANNLRKIVTQWVGQRRSGHT